MAEKKYRHARADLDRVRRYPIGERVNQTNLAGFGRPVDGSLTASEFLDSLPKFLKAPDLAEFIELTVAARKSGHPFHLMLGAHTIKVGLSPVIIDLLQRGIVTGLSFNGAGLIHELELAFFGGTSEDVQKGLTDGTFGMAKETGDLYAEVCRLAVEQDLGMGEAGGRFIVEHQAENRELSMFAAAWELQCPVTVHVGIGTDFVSQHPSFDPAAVGKASHTDFRILADICADLDRGGVIANICSAVILPEVFLKALTVARNLHPGDSRLNTANFDMIEHYRPRVNVVTRPTSGAGKGFSFIGHHELMIPLLAWGLKDRFSKL
jgi:hypothetical protein